MTSFRDRFFTPPVARAMTSASGILAAGSGAAVGMLAGGPVGAVIGGIAGWTARVAAAVPKAPSKPRLDPFALSEPWRAHVRDAEGALSQFRSALNRTRTGPTRERLDELEGRVEDSVADAWSVAQAGHDLAHGRSQIDTAQIERELEIARGQLAGASPDQRATWEKTITALDAQMTTTRRLDDLLRSTDAQLRLLNAQLDETVAKVIELSLRGNASGEIAALGTELESITVEMEALRQALDVVDTPATSPGGS